MKIIALDLGTKTGVAWNHSSWPNSAITWVLATPKEVRAWIKNRVDRRCDPRVLRLYHNLLRCLPADVVVFEDVQFQTFTKQTQLWSSLRAAVWLACSKQRISVECVPVATLKRFATGNGMATKSGMKRALFTRFPEVRPDLDDNAIDALWILKWAEHNLSRTLGK